MIPTVIEINGYTPAEVILSRDATGGDNGDDLRITFVGTGDQLIVYNTLNGSSLDQIEEIAFEDGTVWTPLQIAAQLLDQELTDGNDSVTWLNTADTLEGGLGDDFISGGDGSDTYVFARGDGRDRIEDNGFLDTDRIEINGYTPAEVMFEPGCDRGHR